MKLSLQIEATQLKAGDEIFDGQPVKTHSEVPFAVIKIDNESIKVDEGQWLIEYHDGTKEVWNTEQIQANTGYVVEDISEDTGHD